MNDVKFCPKCLRLVQARDYFTTSGISDWRADAGGAIIRCPSCSYSGPPLAATIEEYKKIREKMK